MNKFQICSTACAICPTYIFLTNNWEIFENKITDLNLGLPKCFLINRRFLWQLETVSPVDKNIKSHHHNEFSVGVGTHLSHCNQTIHYWLSKSPICELQRLSNWQLLPFVSINEVYYRSDNCCWKDFERPDYSQIDFTYWEATTPISVPLYSNKSLLQKIVSQAFI